MRIDRIFEGKSDRQFRSGMNSNRKSDRKFRFRTEFHFLVGNLFYRVLSEFWAGVEIATLRSESSQKGVLQLAYR